MIFLKKHIKLFLATVLVLFSMSIIFASCKKIEGNLVKTGDFEELNTSSKITEWTFNSTATDSKISIKEQSSGIDGYNKEVATHYLSLENVSETESEILQKVSLKRGKLYKLSLNIKLTDLNAKTPSAPAVFVGFKEYKDFSGIRLQKILGEWTKYEIYIKNNALSDTTLRIALGDASYTLAKGKLFLDNISLEQVNSVPNGASLQTLGEDQGNYKDESSGLIFVSFITLMTIAIVSAAFFIIIYFNKKHRKNNIDNESLNIDLNKQNKVFISTFDKIKYVLTSIPAIITYLLVSAFVIRLLVGYFLAGMQSTISNEANVARALADFTSVGAYNAYNNSTPVGIMYIYWMIGAFAKAVSLNPTGQGFYLLIKSPAIIAELITIFVMFVMLLKYTNKQKAAIASAVYATLPVFFLVSSAHIMHIVVALPFMLMMFNSMLEKKFYSTIIMYFVALLFSTHMLIILPLLVIYTIALCIKDNTKILPTLIAFFAMLIMLYIIALPFSISYISKQEALHPFAKIVEYFSNVSVFAANTFNLYSIFGYGNAKVGVAWLVLSVIMYLVIIAFIAYVYFTKANRSDILLLTSLLFTFIATMSVKACMEYYVVAIVLALLYAILLDSARVYRVFASLSVFFVINITKLISQSGYVAMNPNRELTNFAYNDPLMIIFSILSVIVCIYYIYVSISITLFDKLIPINDDVFNFNRVKKDINKIKKTLNRFKKQKSVKKIKEGK